MHIAFCSFFACKEIFPFSVLTIFYSSTEAETCFSLFCTFRWHAKNVQGTKMSSEKRTRKFSFYTDSKNSMVHNFVQNFDNFLQSFKITSLLDSELNLQHNSYYISYHTLSMYIPCESTIFTNDNICIGLLAIIGNLDTEQ